MAKIKLQQDNTVANIFTEFIRAKRAKGLRDKTLHSYVNHFQAVSRHLNVEQDIVNLCKSDLDEMVASMRDAGLSANSINSYTKMLKSFLSWCNQEDITSLTIPSGKDMYVNGECVDHYFPKGEESVNFACKVWELEESIEDYLGYYREEDE